MSRILVRKNLTYSQIIRKIDNIINRYLMFFSLGTHIGDLKLSMDTQRLITKHNRVTEELRTSLNVDKITYRISLNKKKKLLDN